MQLQANVWILHDAVSAGEIQWKQLAASSGGPEKRIS
jgi:hypothetical protein